MTEGQGLRRAAEPGHARRPQAGDQPDYYLDWAFLEAKRLADAGKLGNDARVTIRTALDPVIQKSAKTSLETILRQHGGTYDALPAATVAMDPDGAVRGMGGGRDYGASQFNRATDALRHPAPPSRRSSTTAALMTGKLNPATIVTDRPVWRGGLVPQQLQPVLFGLHAALGGVGEVHQHHPVATGDADRRGQQPGRPPAHHRRVPLMGLTRRWWTPCRCPIGAAEVTVLDMTAGYAVLANAARKRSPTPPSRSATRTATSSIAVTRRADAPGNRAREGRRRHEHHDGEGGGGGHRPPRHPAGDSRWAERPAPRTPTATPCSSATQETSSRRVWFGNDDYSPTGANDGRVPAGAGVARHDAARPPDGGAAGDAWRAAAYGAAPRGQHGHGRRGPGRRPTTSRRRSRRSVRRSSTDARSTRSPASRRC